MSIATGGIGFGSSGSGSGGVTTATAPLVVTGTDVALAPVGQAQGDILYRNATAWVRLGAGTSGQLLKTGGAAANPSWSTILVPDLVYDPAGSASGNVYTSLATLATAAAALSQPKTIFTRLRGADRTVPAGAYNFGYMPTFVGDPNDNAFGLIFPTGATMTDFPLVHDLGIYSTSNAPIVSLTSTTARVFRLSGYAWVDGAGSAPFFSEAGVQETQVILQDNAYLYSDSDRCFVTAGSIIVNAFGRSGSTANTFYGTIAGTLNRMSAASAVSTTQTGGAALTVTNQELSQYIAWLGGATGARPASPTNYQPYFDTTLGFQVWWDGSNWVNAAGVTS